jgi:hypothetical protein
MAGDLFIRSPFVDFIRSLRSFGLLVVLPLLVMGCANLQEDVLVTLPAYQTNLVSQINKELYYSDSSAKIYIAPIKDARINILGDLIGERKSFNTSLGEIEMSPIPVDMIEQLLKSELSALGNEIVDSDEEFRIDGQLNKFKIVTPNTISYWDVNGEVDISLAVTSQAEKKHSSHYAVTCTDRTYVWPGEEILKGVIMDCLGKIAVSLQNDAALTDFLKSP